MTIVIHFPQGNEVTKNEIGSSLWNTTPQNVLDVTNVNIFWYFLEFAFDLKHFNDCAYIDSIKKKLGFKTSSLRSPHYCDIGKNSSS